MLQTRLISAIIAIPVVIGVVYLGELWFALGVGLVGLIAGWEYGRMMKADGYHPTPIITLLLLALLIFDSYRPGLRLLSLIISLTLLGSLAWQLFQHSPTPTADWALTLVGGLYIGWGLAHLVALRGLADGLVWTWLALLSTWGTDTFAYFTGRAIGGPKLWPRHSPKKTWAGFFGGVVGGLFGAAIVATLSNLGWATALTIGAIAAVVGPLGDLSISLMKRDAGIKDSSNLFPGHGGFLDRIDSMLFVNVAVYYYAIWIGLFW